MLAPVRKCCGERHWESEWECPSKDPSEHGRRDFTVKTKPKPPPVAAKPEKKERKKPGPRPSRGSPHVFDPELDLPGSKANPKSILQMRSRRKNPEKHREYMRLFMRDYRKKKTAERKAKRDAEDNSVD